MDTNPKTTPMPIRMIKPPSLALSPITKPAMATAARLTSVTITFSVAEYLPRKLPGTYSWIQG
jgi:hypothetical protein